MWDVYKERSMIVIKFIFLMNIIILITIMIFNIICNTRLIRAVVFPIDYKKSRVKIVNIILLKRFQKRIINKDEYYEKILFNKLLSNEKLTKRDIEFINKKLWIWELTAMLSLIFLVKYKRKEKIR